MRIALATAMLFLLSSVSQAQQYYSPVYCWPLPHAPHPCTAPGFYSPDPYNAYWGYYQNFHPHFPAFNGMDNVGIGNYIYDQLCRRACAPAQGYPYHPWARSPRDFFMWREVMEEERLKERRPNLVP